MLWLFVLNLGLLGYGFELFGLLCFTVAVVYWCWILCMLLGFVGFVVLLFMVSVILWLLRWFWGY